MQLFNYRLSALIKKEFGQIRRDRRVAASLILPPVLQLLLFGFVLNSKVENLRLGVMDDSRTPESRGLTSTLTESKSFNLAGYYYSVEKLGEAGAQKRAQQRPAGEHGNGSQRILGLMAANLVGESRVKPYGSSRNHREASHW